MGALPHAPHKLGGTTEAGSQEETLFRSELTRIFRVRGGGAPVICKELLGPNALQRFHHEKGILERLAGVPGVPKLVRGEFPAGIIAMHDTDAVALHHLVQERLPLSDLLPLAIALAETLAALHGAGVAHKNLTPENILLSRENGTPLLIDYSLATTFAEERPPFVHHNQIVGTFPYLAPEQTGRTGRPVDQRADLYGLGAVLYRLATGTPPFDHGDPLQLVYDILAKRPLPPAQLDPGIPENFSLLVMRLLEKEPDRRYQSAAGVAHDLRLTLGELPGGDAAGFPLGERDFPLRLVPPSRLIGRDAEIAALAGALEGALEGRGMTLLVAGEPGVGKTALVNELRPLVTARRGWFVSGKFDQFRHDPVSSGTVQALRGIGRLLLAEPEAELAQHRERLLAGLGASAGLITASLPEFAAVLGVAPEAMPDDPLEAQTKLFRAAQALLRCVSSPQQPLVMFIDDLQWAGVNSIAFLDSVVSDAGLAGFLLVGAYREEELGAAHPLAAVLPRWLHLATGMQLLRLGNLKTPGVGQLLEEMLRLKPAQAQELARAVAPRTGGNPYDTLEFLNALRKEGILKLGRDGWSWEAAAVRRYLGKGDVLEFLSERLANLPEQTRALLGSIACLGGTVEEGVLRVLHGDELPGMLLPALEDGVLVVEHTTLSFRHDRAQQCVYDGFPPAAREELHLALARRLAPLPELRVLCADQFYAALDRVREPVEVRRAAELFWEAAQHARVTANYPAMERFLAAVATCCSREEGLREEPHLARLETSWHNALYSLGRFEEADRLYLAIERESRDLLGLIEAACIQISSLTNRGRQRDAVHLGLELLERFGFPGPQKLAVEVAEGVELLYRWEAAGAPGKDDRAEVKDPLLLAVARLLQHIIAPAFFTEPLLCYWLQMQSQRLWMEHGPCPALLAGFGGAPLIPMALRQDYLTGCRVAQRAVAVGEARGYEPETSWLRHCYALFGSHWVDPLELSVRQAHLAREGLLRGGDLQFACFTYHSSLAALLDCGRTLESFKEELDEAEAFAARTGNYFSAPTFQGYRQLWRALVGESRSPGSFEDEAFEEARFLTVLAANPLATVKYHVHRALGAALFGEDGELCRHAALAQPLLPYIQGFYPTALAHFLQGLALARTLGSRGPVERIEAAAALIGAKEWLKERTAGVPENFLHLVHFLEAEEAWALGDLERASLAFDAALLVGENRQRPWHRALLAERAAQFQHQLGLTRGSRKLLFEARYLYEAWGAAGKVRQLEEHHPFLHAALKERRGSEGYPGVVVSGEALDLLAILRASQALSSETSLERLKYRVAELMKATTGATSVILVCSDEERGWYLMNGPGAGVLPVAEAGEAKLLPLAAFRYAQRTLEPLLVEDAVHDQRFCRDPYLAGLEHCSLMLVPILNHGAPRALLILENRLSCAAFTPERLDTVKLMAGQLAVSLENARLYEMLEERVAQRTRELQEAQTKLVATARQAGMAEIATNVLHNVGNVLNSVNVSAGVLELSLKDSKASGLARAVRLMKEHGTDLAEYLASDPKGRLLPGYLEKLSQALAEEQQGLVAELARLTRSVDHIKEIVATQQSYAGCSSLVERVRVTDLLEDALRMNAESLSRHEVTVVKRFAEVPALTLDKGRLLQILVNLISNAKNAVAQVHEGTRRLILTVESVAGNRLRIVVADEGEGIPPENLARVFSHGFTTRRGGHGFGLHSCALAAKEMGGTLSAASDGTGQGATFTLELPVDFALQESA